MSCETNIILMFLVHLITRLVFLYSEEVQSITAGFSTNSNRCTVGLNAHGKSLATGSSDLDFIGSIYMSNINK